MLTGDAKVNNQVCTPETEVFKDNETPSKMRLRDRGADIYEANMTLIRTGLCINVTSRQWALPTRLNRSKAIEMGKDWRKRS